MFYNYKYKMEWVGLKNVTPDSFYYRLEFYKLEDTEITYVVDSLICANTPFVIKYKAKEDFTFEPFRASSAEINIYIDDNTVQPEEFFSETGNSTYKVIFKLINVDEDIETSLWTGYVLNSDIEYEWQFQSYLRLTASDNLGILKEYKYSQSDRFTMFQTQDLYEGISIKDFIVKCLTFIGLPLDVKFSFEFQEQYFVDGVEEIETRNELSMFVNEYSAIDWERKYPYDVYKILSNLLQSLGCILYQDNRDSTWTILNINDLATSTDNIVSMRRYDFEGTYISTNDYNIKVGINIDSDVIWSDKNQIVTLKRRIDEVHQTFKVLRRNLVPNYGFFQGDIGTLPDLWAETGISNPTLISGYSNNPYDGRVANLIETQTSGTNTSDFFFTNITLGRFKAIYNVDEGGFRALYDSYQTYFTYNYKFSEAYGYIPISVAYVRPQDSKFLSIGKDGTWRTDTTLANTDRVIAWNNGVTTQQRFELTSKGTLSDGSYTPNGLNWFSRTDTIYILFRPIYVGSSGLTPEAILDNLILNFYPESSKYTDTFTLYATQVTPYWEANANIPAYQINLRDEKLMYHGGIDGEFSAIFYEDCIWTKYVDSIDDTRIMSSNNWLRKWQVNSGEDAQWDFLNANTCSSILSFYKRSGKKFNGNVYAEQTPIAPIPFGFPMYCNIKGSVDLNAIQNQYDLFVDYVTTDGGVIETTDCGADFLAEFYQPYGKYLMVEGEFDYGSNKTLVNLHQDFTDDNELGFIRGFHSSTNNGNVRYITPGSTTNDVQEENDPG